MKVQAPWNDWLAEPMSRDHLVHPYADEQTLIAALAVYAGVGLGKGEAVVLVLTPGHEQSLRARLQADAHDVDDLERWGQLRIVDAHSALETFLVDGLPVPDAFRKLCRGLVADARVASRHGRIRVYGEMVSLLCGRGQERAALTLEMLWNEAVEAYEIPLLCAYHVPSGSSLSEALALAHTHLVPSHACA